MPHGWVPPHRGFLQRCRIQSDTRRGERQHHHHHHRSSSRLGLSATLVFVTLVSSGRLHFSGGLLYITAVIQNYVMQNKQDSAPTL